MIKLKIIRATRKYLSGEFEAVIKRGLHPDESISQELFIYQWIRVISVSTGDFQRTIMTMRFITFNKKTIVVSLNPNRAALFPSLSTNRLTIS